MFKGITTGGRWGRKSNSMNGADRSRGSVARAARAAVEPLEDRLYMFATDGAWAQPGGPGTPMALRYSFSNLLDGGLPTASGFGTAQVRSAIEEALGLWTAVAPIQLTEVADSGGPTNDPWIYVGNHPEIRIGHVPMDGTGDGNLDELAHAYLPNFLTFFARGAVAGDMYFDDGDTWGNGATSGVDMIETAAHELGHALGMAHANGDTRDLDGDGDADCPPPTPALMDACAANLFSGPGTSFLFQDDVNGIRSIYGTGLGYVLDASGVLHVNGTGGNDSFQISGSPGVITVSSASGSFSRLAGGVTRIEVMCRGGNDNVTIHSTAPGVGVTVQGNAGNDSVFISSGTTGDLNRLSGTVVFNGGTGSDRVALSDQGGPLGATYTLNSSSATRTGWVGATYTSTETIDVSGAGGNCVYNVNSLPAGGSTTIADGPGVDTLNLAPASGDLDNVGANVVFFGAGLNGNRVEMFDQNNGAAWPFTFQDDTVDRGGNFGRLQYSGDVRSLHLHAGGGDSEFNVNDLFVPEVRISAGPGNDLVRLSPSTRMANNVHGQLFVDGESGSDLVTVDDRNAGPGTDGNWLLDGATLDKSNPDPGNMLSWAGVEQLRLDGGAAGTTYTVKSLNAGTSVTLNAGGGNDTFNVGSPTAPDRNVDGIQSALVLNGEAGANALNYNDQDNSYLPLIIIFPGRLRENPRGDTYTLTPTTVTRDRSAVVTYGGVQTLTLNGGSQANDFNVTPSAATTFNVNGNDPTPVVIIPFPFPFPLPVLPLAPAAPGAPTPIDVLPSPIDPRPIPFPLPDPEPQWDRLNVNLAGTTTARLASAGAGAGTYTFTNRMPVNFTGMESSNTPPSAVAGRYVFYNRSLYDGDDGAANAADDSAIAPDKQALLPGQSATFANYTTYTRGINGVMVDIAGLPVGSTLSAADFAVHVGMAMDASSWPLGPAPASVTVRRGAGVGGSDRVTLVFADNTIRATWMQLTVLANANTALPAPDVFYFGNLCGETGNNPSAAVVNALDQAATRAAQGAAQPITGRHDFNRDGRVNALDIAAVKSSLLLQIPLYAAPSSPAAASVFGSTLIGRQDLLALLS
jgi:hypothetical protein